MNREAERQRLVELIKDSLNKHIGKSCLLAENIAGDLLKNNIVVLPCKIGETLYDISEYVYGIPSPEIYEMENDRMTIEKLENGDFIFIYEDADIRHEDMGEVIFTTRAEAEKVLKEGKTK